MIDYISGKLATLTPTMAVIDNQGIGYAVEISLQTYDALNGKSTATVFIQRQVNQRDGTEVDYGFATQDERELFRQITSVSGMGAASARMVLSSLSPEELRNIILSEDVNRLKSVKGIGLKTAQRLVLELKDKVFKGESASTDQLFSRTDSGAAAEEASTALQMLGFSKPNVQKAIQAILKQSPGASVEEIIKAALKRL
ncbi:MAG: Holliday junction branch migration protein RuvA [Bacteroidales bacterium]|nr:Holliday junction branch migration protein RuvA [Bacteroidales bacterium]MBR1577688.1 Holliday junction branch migration protein RuvA [Bacteroidales bacterium]